ncbi:MAG: hypothetical protein U0V64_04865 [Cyclobacteriaceae bacterium]
MTATISAPQIKAIIAASSHADLIALMEEGFINYAAGKVVVPPVGYLPFNNPPGDVHIKYGYIKGDPYYVIKIASGFYNNPAMGLNSSNGMMLLFSQQTGEPLAVMLDEGYLTDIRTAVAGAVAARHLAPAQVDCIGIVGTGLQARLQLTYLQTVTTCRKVLIWGRSMEKAAALASDTTLGGFEITPTSDLTTLVRRSQLIVTTTPSREVLIKAQDVQPGTHITAMGADAEGKRELDPGILAKADRVVADSIAQCVDHGECHYAVKDALLPESKIMALGNVIANPALRRTAASQITVADLTGVAIQDIQITRFVYEQILSNTTTIKS